MLGCEDPTLPYTIQLHSQSLPSIGNIMDVYKISFSICKKSLSLCESEEDSGFTTHSWTRQQAGVSGEQNTAVVGSGVGGGIYVPALWMWESY